MPICFTLIATMTADEWRISKKSGMQASLITKLKPGTAWADKSGSETWTCAFAPDESYFAWSCGNRIVCLVPWNSNKNCPISTNAKDSEGKEINRQPITIDCGYLVWAVAVSNSGSVKDPNNVHSSWTHFHSEGDLILATGLSNSRIRIWDIPSGKLLMELMDHKDVIRDLAFAPDDSLRLVSASRDMTLKVWDLRDDGNMFKTLNGHYKWVFACAWSPDASLLASVGSGKLVLVWNMKTYELFRRLEGHSHDVVDCEFSRDGAILATASWDTKVLLWDPYTGEILKSLWHLHPPPRPIFASGANGAWVRGISFAVDGCHLSSIADDGYVRFWNLLENGDPEEIAVLGNALCCTFSPSGRALAIGTRNGSVSFFSAPTQLQTLQHLCRLAIRKRFPSTVISKLELPRIVERYLLYKEWN